MHDRYEANDMQNLWLSSMHLRSESAASNGLFCGLLQKSMGNLLPRSGSALIRKLARNTRLRFNSTDLKYSLPCSQVGAIHTLYLHSAMSDMSLPTSSSGRRARDLTSQESWTDCDGGWTFQRSRRLFLLPSSLSANRYNMTKSAVKSVSTYHFLAAAQAD
jgi:hypothetical protein